MTAAIEKLVEVSLPLAHNREYITRAGERLRAVKDPNHENLMMMYSVATGMKRFNMHHDYCIMVQGEENPTDLVQQVLKDPAPADLAPTDVREYQDIITALMHGIPIQFRAQGGWVDAENFSILAQMAERVPPSFFRVKPRMVQIGDLEVPAGCSQRPDIGMHCWVADLTRGKVESIRFGQGSSDEAVFQMGLLHVDRDAAELTVAAIQNLFR